MKKLFKTLAVLAAVAALGFGFASCSSDDDSSSGGGNTNNNSGNNNSGNNGNENNGNGDNGVDNSKKHKVTYVLTFDGFREPSDYNNEEKISEIKLPAESEYKEGETVTVNFTDISKEFKAIKRCQLKFVGWYKCDSGYSKQSAFKADYTENGTTTFVMQNEDIYLHSVWEPLYIGEIAPDAEKEEGDIIFSDGSARASDRWKITDEYTEKEKESMVAIIFYVDSFYTLGASLKQSEKLSWASSDSEGYKKDIFPGSYKVNDLFKDKYEFTGLTSGQNTHIALKNNVSDYNETNYPAWYYVEHYGDMVTPPTNAKTTWYMPCPREMVRLLNNGLINGLLGRIGSGVDKLTDNFYWTCTDSSESYGESRAVVVESPKYSSDFAHVYDERKNREILVRPIIQF